MKIEIHSKKMFEGMIDFVKSKGNKLEDYKDKFFISILDPDESEVLNEDLDNYKSWFFYDIEYKVSNYEPISELQAKEIVEFINKNRDKKTCIVHCTAGVARSGAIGTYINWLLELKTEEDFKKDHPRISPNELVLKLLKDNTKNIKVGYSSLSKEQKEQLKELISRGKGGARALKAFVPPNKEVDL